MWRLGRGTDQADRAHSASRQDLAATQAETRPLARHCLPASAGERIIREREESDPAQTGRDQDPKNSAPVAHVERRGHRPIPLN